MENIQDSISLIQGILCIWNDVDLDGVIQTRKQFLQQPLWYILLIRQGRDGAVVRALTSHQCGPSSIPLPTP